MLTSRRHLRISPWRQVDSHLDLADLADLRQILRCLVQIFPGSHPSQPSESSCHEFNIHFNRTAVSGAPSWRPRTTEQHPPRCTIRALKCLKMDLLFGCCSSAISAVEQRCVPTVYVMKLVDESGLAAALDVTRQ